MNTIYKYRLAIQDEVILEAHELFRPIHVAEQHPGELYLWALVDTASPRCMQGIRIYGTGQPFEDDSPFEHYVGSVCMMNGLVWHVCYVGRVME